MAARVIVLGGGVAGLSAAHELIERGFEVEVHEALSIPGGKARSIPVGGTGTEGPQGRRRDLPGEHGFRFFPRFYRHVTDTMQRIPVATGRTVFDNLVDTTRVLLARFDRPPVELVNRFPRSLKDVKSVLGDLDQIYRGELGLSHDELAFFASRVWQIVTSCHERRVEEYERIGWWEFIDAAPRSHAYQALLGHGLTRSLVAAKAESASTKTIGDIFVQLLFDIAEPGPSSDRVLNGPTNDVWITPWIDYLVGRGVRYRLESRVTAIRCVNGRIREVAVQTSHGVETVSGDFYVCALPIEDVVPLLTTELTTADPALDKLRQLERATAWMNGVQIFLKQEVDLVHGHVIYVDSPWALTAISQRQFWHDIDLRQYGDGTIRSILSVDISDWERKGLNGKSAKDCTLAELIEEVWAQLMRSHNREGVEVLKDECLCRWFMDSDLQLRDGAEDTNEEPLLVNMVGTWALRPDAVTRIPNLFLASDYVRTYTDLATMEAANEAARRAVNGIIEASGVPASPCRLWKLHEPEVLAPWRALDLVRFRMGLPWDDTAVRLGLATLDLGQEAVRAMERRLDARADLLGESGMDGDAARALLMPASEQASRGTSSELEAAVRALVETSVQLLALRTAEIEARGREGAQTSGRSDDFVVRNSARMRGRVKIVARG